MSLRTDPLSPKRWEDDKTVGDGVPIPTVSYVLRVIPLRVR